MNLIDFLEAGGIITIEDIKANHFGGLWIKASFGKKSNRYPIGSAEDCFRYLTEDFDKLITPKIKEEMSNV